MEAKQEVPTSVGVVAKRMMRVAPGIRCPPTLPRRMVCQSTAGLRLLGEASGSAHSHAGLVSHEFEQHIDIFLNQKSSDFFFLFLLEWTFEPLGACSVAASAAVYTGLALVRGGAQGEARVEIWPVIYFLRGCQGFGSAQFFLFLFLFLDRGAKLILQPQPWIAWSHQPTQHRVGVVYKYQAPPVQSFLPRSHNFIHYLFSILYVSTMVFVKKIVFAAILATAAYAQSDSVSSLPVPTDTDTGLSCTSHLSSPLSFVVLTVPLLAASLPTDCTTHLSLLGFVYADWSHF